MSMLQNPMAGGKLPAVTAAGRGAVSVTGAGSDVTVSDLTVTTLLPCVPIPTPPDKPL